MLQNFKRPAAGAGWRSACDTDMHACACAVIYDYFSGQQAQPQVYNEYETKTTQACNMATKGCCNSGTTLTQLVTDHSMLYDCWANWAWQNFSVQVGTLPPRRKA